MWFDSFFNLSECETDTQNPKYGTKHFALEVVILVLECEVLLDLGRFVGDHVFFFYARVVVRKFLTPPCFAGGEDL